MGLYTCGETSCVVNQITHTGNDKILEPTD